MAEKKVKTAGQVISTKNKNNYVPLFITLRTLQLDGVRVAVFYGAGCLKVAVG